PAGARGPQDAHRAVAAGLLARSPLHAERRRAADRCRARPPHRRLPALEPGRGVHARRARAMMNGRYAGMHNRRALLEGQRMAVTRSIELKTEIPGPRSREILERKERVVAEPLSIFLPVVVEEGHGATVTDVDGNTFIDFTGGVGCLNV